MQSSKFCELAGGISRALLGYQLSRAESGRLARLAAWTVQVPSFSKFVLSIRWAICWAIDQKLRYELRARSGLVGLHGKVIALSNRVENIWAQLRIF